MKHLIIALSLLVATPALAAVKQPTAAEWRDIRKLQRAFIRCEPGDDYPPVKRACALSIKLQDKLGEQGFCFYKRILPGRPSKDERSCLPLHD